MKTIKSSEYQDNSPFIYANVYVIEVEQDSIHIIAYSDILDETDHITEPKWAYVPVVDFENTEELYFWDVISPVIETKHLYSRPLESMNDFIYSNIPVNPNLEIVELLDENVIEYVKTLCCGDMVVICELINPVVE